MYRTCTSRISALSTSVPSALLSSSRVMPGRSRTNSSTLCATVGIGVLYTATQWRRTGRRRWLIDQGNVMFGEFARRGSGHHPRWLRRSDGTHTPRSAVTAARNLIRWHIPDYNPKHRHPGNQGHSLVQYTRTGGRHGGEWPIQSRGPASGRSGQPDPNPSGNLRGGRHILRSGHHCNYLRPSSGQPYGGADRRVGVPLRVHGPAHLAEKHRHVRRLLDRIEDDLIVRSDPFDVPGRR